VFQPVADSFLYGTLMLHLRPIAGNFQDDTISLWAEGAPSGWSARLSTLGVTMVAGQETELVLDLRTLSTGSASILKDVTQYGNLNVYLQNDTAVDDMLLTLSCQNNASPPMLVGVLRGEQGCGNMKAYDVFLDNEDRRNANDRRPWIGATVSDKNTLLRLCGTDGQQFASAAQNGAIFALVALSNRCPDGFVRFDRFHDNEDRNPASWDSAPSGSPTATVGSKRDTNLAFCVAPGPNIPVGNGVFPDLGVPYGVFGGRNREGAGWALDRGWIFLDDEDNNNRNQPRNPPGYTWIFLEGGSNTRYFFARVK
jgi:hypothetical protein